jgi:hypothetical protein
MIHVFTLKHILMDELNQPAGSITYSGTGLKKFNRTREVYYISLNRNLLTTAIKLSVNSCDTFTFKVVSSEN